MDFFNKGVDFLGSKQAPVFLGGLAQAIMGPYQDSWQAQTGGFAKQYGQSAIAADALKKKQMQDAATRKALISWLTRTPGTGIGLTAPDAPGDTDVTTKVGPEGDYTRTVKGKFGSPTGGEAERMGVPFNAPTRPPAAPYAPIGGEMERMGPAMGTPNPNLVPLF